MNVIIVGGGKVGTYLAGLLLQGGHRVRVIEQRAEEAPRLKRDLPPEVVVIGSGTDPSVLESAGIRQAHTLAAVTGTDETNLVVTNLGRFEFAVPRTIGRVNNPKNAWLYTAEMGVDVALNQADMMAHLILEEMSLGDMMTLLELRRGQYSLTQEKVAPNAVAVGKRVRDLPLPTNCVLMAIIRGSELIMPKGDTEIQAMDQVLAIVHTSQLKELSALLGFTALPQEFVARDRELPRSR